MTIKESLSVWYAKHFITWADAKTKYSVKFNAVLFAAGGLWIMLSQDVQTKIVDSVLASFGIPTSWTLVAVALLGLYFRLKKQAPKDEPKAPVEPTVVAEPDSPDDIAADKRIEQLRAETGQS